MKLVLKETLRHFLPRALKPHHIRAGPLRHYRIVTSWHDYPAAILGRTEGPLLAWFARNVNAGETWLDIGAHYGYTAIALAHFVGARGRVFAFEPMLTSAGCIAQARHLNQLAQMTVVPLALGDVPGIALQQLPLVRGMVDSTPARKGNAQTWHETLLVARLDEIWNELCGGATRVHGIKIDVQGMELFVLRGMMGLLSSQHPKMVLEVHEGVARAELISVLRAAGYTRAAQPIEPIPNETTAQFHNDKSYAFLV